MVGTSGLASRLREALWSAPSCLDSSPNVFLFVVLFSPLLRTSCFGENTLRLPKVAYLSHPSVHEENALRCTEGI
jgi:hypothetical protein